MRKLFDGRAGCPATARPGRPSLSARLLNPIGQQTAQSWLASAIAERRLGHALLLYGPAGVGRKTLARYAAAHLLCMQPTASGPCRGCRSCLAAADDSHPDLHILRTPPGKRGLGIDAIRGLIEELALPPRGVDGRGLGKVAIIETAGELGDEAANAFLKTLEEPPENTWLFLVAPRRSQVLPTVRSRCQPLRLSLLDPREIEAVLRAQGLHDDEARRLAEGCGGSLGLALDMHRTAGIAPLDPGLLLGAVPEPEALLRDLALRVQQLKRETDAPGGSHEWRRRLLRVYFAELLRLLRDAQALRCAAAVPPLSPGRARLAGRLARLASRPLENGAQAVEVAREGLARNLNIELVVSRLAAHLPRGGGR